MNIKIFCLFFLCTNALLLNSTHSNSKLRDCSGKPHPNRQCGHLGIYEKDCKRLGCCWNAALSQGFGTPQCFFARVGPTPIDRRMPPVGPPTSQPTHPVGEGPYTEVEMQMLARRFRANLDYDNTGAVITSITEKNHRVRDAAIAIKVLLDLGGDNGKYDSIVQNYISFAKRTQRYMEEPIFDLNGEPCCSEHLQKPQISGIILRALAVMSYLDRIVASPDPMMQDYAKHDVWPVVKKDVDYIWAHKDEEHFDFWGLVKGNHFFVKLLTRCSIYIGASFTAQFGDPRSALANADLTVEALGNKVTAHARDGFVKETWPIPKHAPQKFGDVDIATLIAAIWTGQATDSFFEVNDRNVMISVTKLVSIFSSGVFPVQDRDDARWVPGLLLGRFANDTWNGYNTHGPGQPWVLATALLAQYYYSTGGEMMLAKHNPISDARLDVIHKQISQAGFLQSPRHMNHQLRAMAMRQIGDDCLQRLRFHIGNMVPDMIHADSGQPWGQSFHTMSMAFLLSAWNVRSQIPPP